MWYKKGGELPVGKTKLENFNKALRISNVSEEDSGEYFCLASNKMGSIRHTISVRVKGTSPLPSLLGFWLPGAGREIHEMPGGTAGTFPWGWVRVLQGFMEWVGRILKVIQFHPLP